jgi:hypothetical protein
MLGAYTKAEDGAMTIAFGARGKKRLNRVFDVIGFVYPDYCFPIRKQGGKRKIATSTSSGALKLKRAKVLTRRPKLHSLENIVEVPTIEEVKFIESAEAAPLATETKKTTEQPKLLSPPAVTELLKLSTTATTNPRKRRMASVLNAVLESMKTPTSASARLSGEKIEDAREVVTASASFTLVEAEPLGATPVKLVGESSRKTHITCSRSTSPE